ncbi:MAG TPA: alpha/beta fold hydrolase [Actinomycetota bacterium]|jgi:cholesterol oxidase|nr:alpha/beta fold hydrolase [Actinomycetota bacterium]
MVRYSRPVHELEQHYDVLVVGSGYGGGIAASKCVRAGAKVCLFERGKELHPGEYPSRLSETPRHVQAHTQRGHIGNPTALFDFHLGTGISALVGCGLGGTSLINANVALRAKDWIFDETWPAEFRDGKAPALLEPYYKEAERMLGSNPYPEHLPLSPKLEALGRSSEAFGVPVGRPNLNVTFERGTNAAGVEQAACELCGDCVTGCNYGAKNTVLMNYIPDAYAHGAHIFSEVEVRTIHRRGKEWLVEFRDQSAGRHRFGAPTQFVTADVVVLAAGSLGSTEILLRSRAAGLPISDRIGRSFTGNGDVLAFAFDTDSSVRAVGLGPHPVPANRDVGPCISGVIDLMNEEHPSFGMIIQEGSVPGALAPIVGAAWAASAAAFGIDDTRGAERFAKRAKQLAGAMLGPRRGPADRTLTYLVMSIDDDNGRLVLDDDRLNIQWPDVAKRPVIERDNNAASIAARAIGGTFVPNPVWKTPFGRSLITVHPLGGCDMGDHAGHGVVNHKGQVFDGETGTDVHDGLYVADGAIVPRPIGANPSLTISALAERISDLLVQERKWEPAPPPPYTPPSTSGLRFTERMTGFISTRVHEDFDAGYAQGTADDSRLDVVLTISYENLAAALARPESPARISGTVFAPELSKRRLTVIGGEFQLFVHDPEYVETDRMIYRLELLGEDGKRYHLEGHKLIRERGSLRAWPDTTTLYVTVSDSRKRTLGVGIIHVGAVDFLRQLRTMKTTNRRKDVREPGRFDFMQMFTRKLLSVYGGPLDRTRFPATEINEFGPVTGHRKVELPAPDVIWCDQEDKRWREGIKVPGEEWPRVGERAFLRLVRYRGGEKGPILLAAGFGMSAASYVADTTDQNLAEFLVADGYDVWLFDYRAGIELPSARRLDFTFDDVATVDWPVAVAKVREVTGAASVQLLGHCMGSMSIQMALLAGLGGVRSAVCSQGMAIVDPAPLVRLKNTLRVGHILDGLRFERLFPPRRRTVVTQALDVAMRALPMASNERCGLALCRWINAIYGLTHTHTQLNDETHTALNQMFDVGALPALRHVALIMKFGHVVDNRGREAYMPNAHRLKDTRLLLLQGEKNFIFLPEGSKRTARWLRNANGSDRYERRLLRDYAHLDGLIGRNAHVEVFPKIHEFLEKTGTTI